ncbi:hypothetical protein RHMOL_Rhmol06G0197000 [Rhododendron molle]|uniref:Uncharacterized protein n=1 Tax=Rhododendron molle TaxID=49168 RepID=A0ACC0NEC4_RHOML|nr:hypothetical protein RHMOL_Rhmol06G0197000 [Rhododendron molle]
MEEGKEKGEQRRGEGGSRKGEWGNPPPAAYPPPLPPSTAAYSGPYVAPPPMGYPMKDTQSQTNNFPPPGKTQAKGDGFWKGCCAALCCCCVLDACF